MTQDHEFLGQVIHRYTEMAKRANDWFSDERWPYMLDLANKLEDWLEATPPQRILDLACGTGAPTVALALKGYQMTGLDLTPAMLDVARHGACRKDATVEWLCQDMRTLACHEAFDHVMLRDVIFGIFENEEDDADLVRRIALALRPGGRCLFEVYNKEFAKAHGIEDALFYDERSDRFAETAPATAAMSMKLYSHEDWERMLKANGLRIVRTDGWKWKQDPDPPPWRANYIIAQKKAE